MQIINGVARSAEEAEYIGTLEGIKQMENKSITNFYVRSDAKNGNTYLNNNHQLWFNQTILNDC